ncbi:MAG TPA: DUF488 family protein [Alcanivorax sp.]|nr:DUF488 family protein [Alcanivorax sp.]
MGQFYWPKVGQNKWPLTAPSSELRKWFNHDPKRWAAFYQKFHAELDQQGDAVESVLKGADGGTLTLLYAAKDEAHNNAVALKMYIQNKS